MYTGEGNYCVVPEVARASLLLLSSYCLYLLCAKGRTVTMYTGEGNYRCGARGSSSIHSASLILLPVSSMC